MHLQASCLDEQSVLEIYSAYNHWLKDVPHQQLDSICQEAELLFRRVGITFNVL